MQSSLRAGLRRIDASFAVNDMAMKGILYKEWRVMPGRSINTLCVGFIVGE